MGAIYAAAQLTIVAAAGSEPSAGLPGVTKARSSRTVEHLGKLTLIPHLTSGLANIHRSTWATRAWTFQEGFLSRRRLFFTDTEVVYICATSVYLEHGNLDDDAARTRRPGPLISLLPSDQNRRVVPLGEHILGPAMTLLEEYTKRSLSYDSDALNAIVGALNTLTSLSRPIHHVNGVPYAERTFAQPVPVVTVALHWYHARPARRRSGFPSWSPLGWQGPVNFHRRDQPSLPSECDIKVCRDGNSLERFSAIKLSEALATTACRFQVTALVVSPSFVSMKDSAMGDNHICIAFPWSKTNGRNKSFDVCVVPYWDQKGPPKTSEHASIICVSFSGDPRGIASRASCIMLLLQYKGPHYERIGYVDYPKGEHSSVDSVFKQLPVAQNVDGLNEARSDKPQGERALWFRKRGRISRVKDEVWVGNSCWIECVPNWLENATRKTFLLG